jgi:DNA-binding LytR/AlgR family response regulator
MKQIKIFIAEDEVFISEQLNDILLTLGYQVTEIGFDLESSIAILQKDPPDISILDIQMHGKNQGFEIASYIRENLKTPVIFLTSFSDPKTVEEAVGFEPAAYLMKPFSESDIYSSIALVLNQIERDDRHIIILDGLKKSKVSIKDILWLKSSDKYIEIITPHKKYLERLSLSAFIEKNSLKMFERTHRSYYVNMRMVDKYFNQKVIIGGSSIPVSRKYAENIKSYFNVNRKPNDFKLK